MITTTLGNKLNNFAKWFVIKSSLLWHYFDILGCRVLFWAGFSSEEWVRNGIPRVCFYICFVERNSELFSLPLKCSEGNSESFLLFLFKRMEFRVIFSSTEGFETELWGFSVPRNSRNSAGNNHLFRLFRLPRNNFLSEIPNPSRVRFGLDANE